MKSDSTSSVSVPSAGSAKFTGVKLVGTTVKNTNGILSEFSNGSYALIEPAISPGNAPIEAAIEFTMPDVPVRKGGLMGNVGDEMGFSPFYIRNFILEGDISSTGKTWDIASVLLTELPLKPKSTYRLKCSWNGKEYSWFVWRGNWVLLKKVSSNLSAAWGSQLQFGTNCGKGAAFAGTINLNKCYISIDGKLWWEGVRGAYKNANK